MSPPRCHSGSSDNGTPAFGNTSFSITPVHRHHIFKPRGAETEALLALWGSCWCPVVILVILSSRWMCCAVWLHFILYNFTSMLVLWFIALLQAPSALHLLSYCTSCSLDEHYDGMFDCILSIYLSNSVLSNISMLEAFLYLQSHFWILKIYKDYNYEYWADSASLSLLHHDLAAQQQCWETLSQTTF